MYSSKVYIILVTMVVTGATRLVAVKSLYQLDFENPWLVTLLYLTGQALSLIVYWLLPCLGQDNNDDNDDNDDNDINHHNKTNGSYEAVSNPLYTNHKDMSSSSSSTTTTTILTKKEEKEETTTTTIELASLESTATKTTIDDPMVVDSEEQLLVLGRGDDDKETEETQPTQPAADNNPRRRWLLRQGSETGLTPESKTAVAWIHSIPWYFQPILPGICNAMNGAMRWASLLFVRASIAEMLISGLELVLSAVAARVLRQRTISTLRWCGVGVVTIGMLLVRFADLVLSSHPNNDSNHNNNNDYAITNSTATTTTTTTTSINSSSRRDIWISTLLIIGQCIMSVLQDLAEEVFMQEAHVPATLLLGMEGLFGLLLGIPVYLWLVPDSAKVFSAMNSSDDGDGTITTTTTMVLYPYLIALTLLFTVTGIFNILATSVTSSMTRNVWKNLRTMLVWIFGLVVYYYHYYGNPSSSPSSSSSPPPPPPRLGEAWEFPESAIVMLGFGIMLGGIGIYYLDSRLAGVGGYVPLSTMATSGAKEGEKEEDEDDNKYDNNNKESTMEKGSGIQES